ncbi:MULTISPECIES: thioredoxin family protein [unclassified Variovorax]|jgi:thioredoxin 1|uniref:thioredoxin family protein n=1 Tax=Variovorax TaxID=34072 RepID=UPI0008EA78AB|nr:MULTISPECIES: thioredoxin family protein [unclassified Variovorax]KAF1071818.1 MAG: Thioredoxin [Variovorax sp.]MBS75615.1 thioredoxin [Variovorax sp.]SFP10630.1 thioredoxin 1 [Variovorax sp. PDC80]
MTSEYKTEQPERSEIDALQGPAVVEFGTNWCGVCKAAQPDIAAAFAQHPGLRHIKVEDGSGRPLGRSFGVKLWPTLVFMRDGREVAKLVRPTDSASIAEALAKIAQPA